MADRHQPAKSLLFAEFCKKFPDLGSALQLFRIESERLKLPAPFSRRIAEPFDADAAGQATLRRCLDKIRCEEGERDGHVGLPNAAFLASAKLCPAGSFGWWF